MACPFADFKRTSFFASPKQATRPKFARSKCSKILPYDRSHSFLTAIHTLHVNQTLFHPTTTMVICSPKHLQYFQM